MKTCKRCAQSLPLSAFSPRRDARDGLAYWCTPCKSRATVEGPRRKAVVDAYRARNRHACAARVAASVAKKPEQYRAKAREIAARKLTTEPEKLHAQRRGRYRQNPVQHIVRSRTRGRRMRTLPPWVGAAHRAEMQGFYRFCQLFPAFEVDHTVPLNGKIVSGLHVPENLQVLTIRANRQKGANYEVL